MKFVQLVKLGDLWTDDERWQANVRDCEQQDNYTFEEGEDGNYVFANFAADEVEFADVTICDFMGDMHGGDERFYERDMERDLTVRCKTDGKLYVRWRENLDAF